VDWSDFKPGDVVRWKAFGHDFEFHYGLIVSFEEFSEYHHYQFPFERDYDLMTGIGYLPLKYEYVSSVSVFSFSEQKTRIIYQSSMELPYQLELVAYDSDGHRQSSGSQL
jgi:hypothetical protein